MDFLQPEIGLYTYKSPFLDDELLLSFSSFTTRPSRSVTILSALFLDLPLYLVRQNDEKFDDTPLTLSALGDTLPPKNSSTLSISIRSLRSVLL